MLSRDNSVPPDLVSKIRTYRKRYFEPKFTEIIKAAKTSKLRTITHGDFWNNNMMINDDNPGNKKITKNQNDFAFKQFKTQRTSR